MGAASEGDSAQAGAASCFEPRRRREARSSRSKSSMDHLEQPNEGWGLGAWELGSGALVQFDGQPGEEGGGCDRL